MHSQYWTLTDLPRHSPKYLGIALSLAITLHIAAFISLAPLSDPLDKPAKQQPTSIKIVMRAAPPPAPQPQKVATKTEPAKPRKNSSKPKPQSIKPPAKTVTPTNKAPTISAVKEVAASPALAVESELASYLQQVKQQIKKHKRYPSQARRKRLQGTVEVSFQWNADGQLIGQNIKHSSGYKLLDKAALKMLTQASPLPTPPPSLDRDNFHASLPINFLFN